MPIHHRNSIQKDIMSDKSFYKAVIFDLDDTLYPYLQYIQSGMTAVQRYLDAVYGIDSIETSADNHENGWEEILEYLCRKQLQSLDNRLAVRLKHVFLTHIPKLQLFREAQTAFACLHQMNIHTGVFAPGPPHAQRMKVRALGVENLCDMIIYPEDLLGHDTITDSITMLSLTMDIPTKRMIIAGNMGLTDFRPLASTDAALLAAEHHSHNINSDLLLEQGQIHNIKSLIEIPNYAAGSEPVRRNLRGGKND